MILHHLENPIQNAEKQMNYAAYPAHTGRAA